MLGGLTPRGLSLVVAAGLLWAVGRLVGVDALYAIAVACAVLVVCSAIVVRLSTGWLSIRRSVSSTRMAFGAHGECHIGIRNVGRLPSGTLYLADQVHWSLAEPPQMVVGSLAPGQVVTVSYPLRATQRGRHAVGPLSLEVADPFGICRVTRPFERKDWVTVYPRMELLGRPPVGGNNRGSGTSSQRRLLNAGDEFHTMREYVQGDDLRLVNWMATAKWEKMMVRQHEQPWDAEATLFVDTRSRAHTGVGPDSTLEKTLSVAASIIAQLQLSSYRMRMFTDDDRHPRGFEPDLAMLDRLAELSATSHPMTAPAVRTLMRSGSEGLLIAVLPAPPAGQPDRGDAEIMALRSAGRHHSTRQAVIVHAPGRQADAAAAMAASLSALDWATVTVATNESFAPAWQRLGSRRRARAPQTSIVTPDLRGSR